METKRTFTAVVISLIILIGYQYIFMPGPQPKTVSTNEHQTNNDTAEVQPSASISASPQPSRAAHDTPSPLENIHRQSNSIQGRDITVETSLYTAIFSENGGVIKSFKLKKYKEALAADSPAKELIQTTGNITLPLNFTWGNEATNALPLFKADAPRIDTSNGDTTLTMTAKLSSGLTIHKTLVFADNSYLINLRVTVQNESAVPFQGAPSLQLVNRPFSVGSAKTSFLFNGPALYMDDSLNEVKVKNLKEGAKSFTGKLSWAAYEGTYFICSVIPQNTDSNTVNFSVTGENQVTTAVNGSSDIIAVMGSKTYDYQIFFGPKRLSTLKEIGSNLNKAINFGWFDMLAKPTLYFLNFLNHYIHNYGIAIILVTVFFKLILWPISHKGMKSMKTMQKIQPKMAKLKEKYKDNKDKLNQEMILLYKTYKINPLGGCLPMVVQIPVFFALYRVLLQTIELRHAPFMLWITDLSAPDRLQIGIDIPGLHGIPVLTLLMGASMFLQQKMTPTATDPTQAKVMLFLPVIFTFMFLNFASGLVLYWFVNNLLSIGQQYYINKSID